MILIEIPEYQHYVIFVDPGVSTIKNNRLVYFLLVYLHIPPVPPLPILCLSIYQLGS